ncbi:uncharacterized protein LOC131435029 isoform X2 [Malaya genurostris]|uniref:uncharacterized protein LOC131435029 isoform X2 n=1 Tax=Malaya genurostris TaxID=325434 RepID=UPI0026F3C77D|nr:uncharacterized protein LOC131435029 isoform X2 [Malaya genurostris]
MTQSDEEVNEEAFMFLTEDIIRELIPKLGKRAIFIGRYAELKTSLANDYSTEDSNKASQLTERKPTPTVAQDVPLPSLPSKSDTYGTYETMTVEELDFDKQGVENQFQEPSETTQPSGADSDCDPFFEIEIEGEPLSKRLKVENDPDEGNSADYERFYESDEDFTGFPERADDSASRMAQDWDMPIVERLKMLLAESPLTRKLLELERLDKVQGIQLANAVVNYLIVASPNAKVSTKTFARWAQAINELFPLESADLYCSQSHISGRSGRLVERYRYLGRSKSSELTKMREQCNSSAMQGNESFVNFDVSEEDELLKEFTSAMDGSKKEMNTLTELKKIVQSCSMMRHTLSAQFLTCNQRNILTANIINYLMDKHCKVIPPEEMKKFAAAIEELYPKENSSIYFRRPKDRGRAHGKLPDRFGYVKRKSFKTGNVPRELLCKKNPMSQLRVFQTVDNVKQVWNSSYEWRKVSTRKLSPIKVIELFPALSQNNGYLLFLEDFNREFPDSINAFSQNWPTYSSSILRYMEQSENFLQSVIEYNVDQYEVNPEVSTLILLPLLFKPSKRSARYWSPGRLEIAHSFVLYGKEFRDVINSLRLRRKILERFKLRLTPVVVAIGPNISTIDSCFIVIHNVFYKFAMLQEAVEVCIKIYAALGERYLEEVSAPWLFVQRFVMKVTLPTDNIPSKIFTLLEAMDLPLR